jgi:hypothetical protein
MRGEDRGQTSLDFAAGMSALLLVFAFVLTFVPGIIAPFTASGQAETVVADRVADSLVEGLLAVPGTPYILDTDCTTAFFDLVNDDADATNDDVPTGGCAFEPIELRLRIGISQYSDSSTYRQQVNVTISTLDGENVLCWDGSTLVEKGDVGCVTPYEIGPDPPTESGSVVAARRIVSIAGRNATLSVRVW